MNFIVTYFLLMVFCYINLKVVKEFTDIIFPKKAENIIVFIPFIGVLILFFIDLSIIGMSIGRIIKNN